MIFKIEKYFLKVVFTVLELLSNEKKKMTFRSKSTECLNMNEKDATFYKRVINVIVASQQAPDVCLTSDIGYILVATSYNQFPTSIRRHFLTSFGRLDWTLF